MIKLIEINYPDCDSEIKVEDDVLIGEILSCSECGIELEVSKRNENSIKVIELGIDGEDWGE